ncbi:MAG: DUF89 family protein [Spirochaetales bacterium]|nr:DUF89 family protein [Spirochaetales bacterium]
MNAKPDCTICLMKQYLQICRLSGLEESELNAAFSDLIKRLPEVSFSMTPPEMAAFITGMIKKASGVSDPYKTIKKNSNEAALKLYPELKLRVERSGHPFAEALCLAIAGNLIDFGAKASLNLNEALEEILSQPLLHKLEEGLGLEDALFQLDTFYNELKKAESVLYLGDNAGEIVFDRIFIETLIREFPDKKITFAVRGGPALNDALLEDAEDVGISEIVETVSSGCAAAGTVLSKCSEDFLKRLGAADIIIAKGQGNYESLSGSPYENAWFLFRIKCQVVAESAGGPEGKLVLKKNEASILDPIGRHV